MVNSSILLRKAYLLDGVGIVIPPGRGDGPYVILHGIIRYKSKNLEKLKWKQEIQIYKKILCETIPL